MSLCGHNFCSGCIGGHTRGAPNWRCPVCRQLNNRNVDSLPRNFILERMIESMRNLQVQPSLNQKAEFGFCDHHQRAFELREYF